MQLQYFAFVLGPGLSQLCLALKDFLLAGLLLLGAVIGAQFGSRVGALLRGEQLRGLLALMVLAVCLKLGFDLVVQPSDLFSVELLK